MESLPQENDGAIEFWRIKDNLQKHFLYCQHWSDDKWKKKHGKRRRKTRKDTSIVLIHQEQSCTSELFKSIQDAVPIDSYFTGKGCYSERLLPVHSSCRMCNQFYIPSSIRDWYLEVKNLSKQTDSILSACGSHGQKTVRILMRSTWVYRVMHNTHAQSMEETSELLCIGSTSILLWRKDWSSIRHDRTLSFFTKHSQLIVFRKLFEWKTGEVIYEKVYASPRPPPKISLKHDWMKEFGFRSCSTTRWTSCSTV